LATGRNLVWVGVAAVVVLGLGGLVVFGGSTGSDNGRPTPRAVPKGSATAVTVKPAPPVRSLEERVVTAAPFERPVAPEGAPNVVLVVLSAARKDQLSPYGAAAGVTPFLARVAGKGARFLDTIADAPSPRAASAAMLTGRHSWHIGIPEPGPEASARTLPDDVQQLSEHFRRAGWTTLGATGNHNLNQDPLDGPSHGGIGRGFDKHLNAQERGFAPGRRQGAGFIVTEALKMVDERPAADRPVYLQLNLIDTNAPVRVIEEQLGDFEPDRPNAPYRAALNRIDGQLERLWKELGDRGLTDNTFLVVVADHGEGLDTPAHHGTFHGRLLYESSVAVPWIVVGPGVKPNQLVGGLAAGVDVAPTVLDLAGLPVPEGLDGMSHASLLRGDGARTQREKTWSATWQFTAKRASSWTSSRQCQLDFGSTDISDSFVDACYDRRTDPAFTRVVEDREAMDALNTWAAEVDAALTE